MPASSYQAQQVLRELSRRLALEKQPVDGTGVRVSTISIIDDEPAPQKPPMVTAKSPVDTVAYSPAVERELERRAGTFMEPPVAPRQPANPIPKTGLRPVPIPPKRNLGEGD